MSVTPGAEAWSAEGGDVGVLVLHGLSGNPVSMRPLAENLASAGFAVQLPRLPGHGTRWQEMAETRWADWAREAMAGLAALRARTRAQVTVGLSMGGALALHLAATDSDLAGVVAINPSIVSTSLQERLLPAVSVAVPSIRGIGNDIAKPGSDEKPYPRLPLKAAASFVKARDQVRRRLVDVHAPLLVLTSRVDHTVPTVNSRVTLDGVSSLDKHHVWLERSYHVATLDYDAALISRETVAFVRRVTGP